MKYSQSTGKITSESGSLFGIGYSGHGEGKNNPAMENISNVGPLPKGKYSIGLPYNSEHTGPFTIPLYPFPSNEMFGRSDFKIHGDDGHGTASLGCICTDRETRENINNCTDKVLEVTE